MARILAVHDRPADAGALVDSLESHGHTVTVCGDSWSAAQSAASDQPDIVVIDLSGPAAIAEPSGRVPEDSLECSNHAAQQAEQQSPHLLESHAIELCRGLKGNRRSQRIPVILLVGGESEIVRGLSAGADLCALRPIESDLLAARVDALTGLNAEHASLRQQNRRLRRQLAKRRQAERALRRRTQVEALLHTISWRFVQMELADLDHVIADTLEEVGRFLGVERNLVFLFSEDLHRIAQTFEWYAEGLEPVAVQYCDTNTSRLPWWMQQLRSLQTIGISHLDELPGEAHAEQQAIRAAGVRSCLAVPLAYQGQLHGFLGLGSIQHRRSWSAEEVFFLRTVGDVVAAAIVRTRTDHRSGKSTSRPADLERKRAEEALQASQKELAIHKRLAQVFLTRPEDGIYAAVVEILLDTFGCQHGFFGYIDEQGDLVGPSMACEVWGNGQACEGMPRFPRSQWQGLRGRSLLEKKTLFRNTPAPVPEGHVGIERILVAPILHMGELVGQLAVANRAQDFRDSDVATMNTIADCVAPVLQARLQKDRIARQGYHTEHALHENLQSLFNSLDDFLWVLDPEGKILMVNRVVTQRLGYAVEEFIGASVLKVHPEHSRAEAQATLARMLAGGTSFCAIPLLAKDGTLLPVETRVTRGHWQGREAIFAISREMTERLNAEREVQQYTKALETANQSLKEYYCKAEVANRAKTHFLANMSHELRTPLHGILSFATFGIKKIHTASTADLLRYFEKIEHSGKVLLALVNDLLDLSKLESGRMTYDVERVDLYTLALSAADECSSLASHRGIHIVCSKPERATRVFADPAKIMQVLRNVLSNAIKFSPDGGAIDIEIHRTERTVAISVLDRGVGIPEEELEAVFDKFIQSSKTHTGAGGTGLGLAICREIITAHGGQIHAANRPGGGAVLTFELPLVFKPPETASHTATAMPTSQAIAFSNETRKSHGSETNSHCG